MGKLENYSFVKAHCGDSAPFFCCLKAAKLYDWHSRVTWL